MYHSKSIFDPESFGTPVQPEFSEIPVGEESDKDSLKIWLIIGAIAILTGFVWYVSKQSVSSHIKKEEG